jgi:hypothetical protein
LELAVDLVAVLVLVLGLGLVLGYLAAVPRVRVLEKALLKARVRESELEMALDYQRAKAMGKD